MGSNDAVTGERWLPWTVRQIQSAYRPGTEDEGEFLGVLSAILPLSDYGRAARNSLAEEVAGNVDLWPLCM